MAGGAAMDVLHRFSSWESSHLLIERETGKQVQEQVSGLAAGAWRRGPGMRRLGAAAGRRGEGGRAVPRELGSGEGRRGALLLWAQVPD